MIIMLKRSWFAAKYIVVEISACTVTYFMFEQTDQIINEKGHIEIFCKVAFNLQYRYKTLQ